MPVRKTRPFIAWTQVSNCKQNSKCLVSVENKRTNIESRRELAAAIRKGEMLPEEIRVARRNLSAEIRRYRKTQLQQMPDLGDIIAARKEDDKEEQENVEVENEVLFLPSDLVQSEIQIGGLKKFADIEYKLWEGQANEAIMMLSNSIIHCMLLNDT